MRMAGANRGSKKPDISVVCDDSPHIVWLFTRTAFIADSVIKSMMGRISHIVVYEMKAVYPFFLVVILNIVPGSVYGQSLFDSIKDRVKAPSAESTSAHLTDGEMAGGLREALTVGMERVIGQVGTTDGFNLDPEIHIPLPGSLRRINSALSTVGMSHLTADLETRLNRAAEAAAPEAKALFIDSISNMTLSDAQQILTGPDDAATRYFREQTSERLTELMRPVVQGSLNDVGALQAYDQMVGEYQQIPFVPDVSADLTDYTIEKSMDGIFYYLAKEEAAIRDNPLKRSTDLLKKVFAD